MNIRQAGGGHKFAMAKKQRLDKVLSHLGVASRSELRKWAKQGRITVDGQTISDSSMQIDPKIADIQVDGVRYVYREFIYVMLNKPQGVVSATEDQRDTTVLELLADDLRGFRPFPVGRLDKDTEGLLLLTNDGVLSHQLLSPRKHVPKTYIALVEGDVTEQDIRTFEQGVTLDDGYVTMPAKLYIEQKEKQADRVLSSIRLTIHEGKFHQVKRMFLAVGKKVITLKRIQMGPLELDPALPPGSYRELTVDELNMLQAYTKERDRRETSS